MEFYPGFQFLIHGHARVWTLCRLNPADTGIKRLACAPASEQSAPIPIGWTGADPWELVELRPAGAAAHVVTTREDNPRRRIVQNRPAVREFEQWNAARDGVGNHVQLSRWTVHAGSTTGWRLKTCPNSQRYTMSVGFTMNRNGAQQFSRAQRATPSPNVAASSAIQFIRPTLHP